MAYGYTFKVVKSDGAASGNKMLQKTKYRGVIFKRHFESGEEYKKKIENPAPISMQQKDWIYFKTAT